ncbi:sensor histidine kinase [Paenibacillus turpanensis]|uniref:sensor histidine kinase n=1 Tax=Paenibacillus turpanensis TaxID=2689078 RepID=UPI00140E7A54|nr:HAMP domain-containing sensor histidine kinase [Paenibacillus turpanensis]
MFRRLRNRFLIVNLVIISVMMLLAFASIYLITYQNVRSDIDMELRRSVEMYNKPAGRPDKFRSGLEGDGPPGGGGGPPSERSVSFAVQTDLDGNILSVNSRYDMEQQYCEQAVQAVIEKRQDRGQLKLEDYYWAYTYQPTPQGSLYIFLDVSDRQDFLNNLVITFAAVGLIMLFIIFFISRYFANRSIAPVKEAFDKQKQFIADASHELKTPLAIINTNADVLLANSEDTIRSQSKWLQYIKSETERMTKLTNDLLYLTELDDSRIEMLHSAFPLSEAVEDVILTMEAVIFEKQLTLSYDIEPGLSVHGSSEQIKQVIMILLDNAIKYTNSSGTIDVQLKKRHHEALLTVTNSGEGIAPEHLERIFDRFYRSDPSRARKLGGYGLGLAIAKAMIEQHKGKISCRSTVGDQTTFTVQLPLKS